MEKIKNCFKIKMCNMAGWGEEAYSVEPIRNKYSNGYEFIIPIYTSYSSFERGDKENMHSVKSLVKMENKDDSIELLSSVVFHTKEEAYSFALRLYNEYIEKGFLEYLEKYLLDYSKPAYFLGKTFFPRLSNLSVEILKYKTLPKEFILDNLDSLIRLRVYDYMNWGSVMGNDFFSRNHFPFDENLTDDQIILNENLFMEDGIGYVFTD